MIRTSPALILALLAGLAAATPVPALAQNALGDGTALDRNLLRGSNGKNSRVRDLQAQINFNNAIVSGNAPFGRSIRGGGQFRSPGEFSGAAGSNSMFRFERDSFASGLAASGARGTDALRYQFALATGSYVPQMLGDVGAVTVRRPGTAQGSIPASSTLRSTSDFLAAQALRPTMAGYRKDADGSVFSAAASPLTGVGWMRVEPDRSAGQQQQTTRSATGVPNAPVIPGQPLPPPTPTNPSNPQAPSGSEVARVTRQAAGLTGLEPGAAGMPGSLQSSAMLNMRAPDLRVQSRSEEHARLIRAIDTAFDPTAIRRSPESTDAASTPAGLEPSPWEGQLAQIRKRLSSDTWMIDAEARTAPTGPGIAPVPAPGQPNQPDTTRTEPNEATEPADAAVDPGLEFAAQALGVDVKTMRALRDAGVRFERLSDPNLADQPSYRRQMAAGEQLLGAGRFFDAEDRFLRAMAALPGDPMAQVGRLHSQLGAGLFLSAALNLRQIFADHPEMVAARYAAALRPDDERTAKIATSLREEMAATESALGRDAALLLAYLGHITDNAELAAEGLKTLRDRTPDDDLRDRTLIALLEGAWSSGSK